MKVEDLKVRDGPYTLSNGAQIQRLAVDCVVCLKRNEVPSPTTFRVDYGKTTILICEAHADQLLNWDEERTLKGGVWEEFTK